MEFISIEPKIHISDYARDCRAAQYPGDVYSYLHEVKISNYSNTPVIVADRAGMYFQAEDRMTHRSSTDESELVVHVTYRLSFYASRYFIRHVESEGIGATPELIKTCYDIWSNIDSHSWRNNQNTRKTFTYTIPISKISGAGGTVYVKELDLVFSIRSDSKKISHPYSYRNAQMNMLDRIENKDQFIQSIRIVDSAGVVGPKWIKTNGGVCKIEPVDDKTEEDGFYIVHSSFVSTSKESSTVTSRYYPREELVENLTFYNSYHEALNSDSESRALAQVNETNSKLIIAQTGLERAQIENANLQTKYELDKVRHNAEIDRLQREFELLKQQHELAVRNNNHEIVKSMYERENLEIKHANEKTSGITKIISEISKFAYTVIPIIVAVFKFIFLGIV